MTANATSPDGEASSSFALTAPTVGGVLARRISDEMKLRLLGHPGGSLRFGRYRVLRRLGAGSQGVVYEARDDALQRRVALKLLSSDALSGRDRVRVEARLKREAATLAQIHHPNVVEVFDVGLEHDGEDAVPYIVMELVDGTDADSWSREGRDWREVIAMFIGAGEGLAAAHRCGIAHRDFKPANVLVGPDDVPRVADFGLARGVVDTAMDHEIGVAGEASITRTGAVLGTPAFMAPEQHAEGAADAKADQFAFCASLYRCLYRVHAFPGGDAQEIFARKASGPAVPPRSRAPRAVWAVLRRGLQPDPRDRHPDMQALLVDLRGACRSRSRRGWVLASGLASALPLVAMLGDAPQECTDATLREVWTTDHADALRDDLQPARLFERLDRYRSEYLATFDTVCAGDDGDVRRAALRCLASRRDSFDVLHEVMTSNDPAVAEHSLVLAGTLPSAHDCLDARIVATYHGARTSADGELTRLSLHGILHFQTGRLPEARAYGMDLVDRASKMPGHDVLVANGLMLVGAVDLANEDWIPAATNFTRAYALAHANVDDVVAARAAAQMVAVSIESGDENGVETWSRHSQAARQRAGGDAVAEMLLSSALGERAFWAGRYDEAARHQERVVGLVDEIEGPSNGRLAAARNNLAVTYDALGRYEDALALHEQNRHSQLGDDPALLFSESNLGALAWKLGRADEARAHLLAAARIGEAHGLPDVGGVWISLAAIEIADGRLEDAAASIRAARSIEDASGPVVGIAIPLAEAQLARAEGRLADADAAWTRAHAQTEDLSPEHPVAIAISIERGLIDAARGEIDDGVQRLEHALALIGSANTPLRGETLVELGRLLVVAGRRPAAVAPLVEAVEVLSAAGIESRHAHDAARLLAAAQIDSCCDAGGCRVCT